MQMGAFDGMLIYENNQGQAGGIRDGSSLGDVIMVLWILGAFAPYMRLQGQRSIIL